MGRTYDDAIKMATKDSDIDVFKRTIELCKEIEKLYAGKPIAKKIDSNSILTKLDAITRYAERCIDKIHSNGAL